LLEEHSSRRKIYLIHDNASYHKTAEVREWLSEHAKRIHLTALPPYCPEFNATERIWHHLRLQATHNRYYDHEDTFVTQLESSLNHIRANPHLISGYLQPFL